MHSRTTVTGAVVSRIALIAAICACFGDLAATQTLFDRFRPANESAVERDDPVKVVPGTKVKRFERLTVPLGGSLIQQHPSYYTYGYVLPQWQAAAKIVGEGESEIGGMVTFQQLPYSSDVRVTINVTGLPVGKHALHIHTYGDLSEGCKSTGLQFPNNFLGNVDTKEDGSIAASFLSVYLNLFGFNGIVGRSIVIHEKPIDLNTALNAEVFSSSLQSVPNALAYQNEENSVGPPVACGTITIVRTLMSSMTPAMMMPQK